MSIARKGARRGCRDVRDVFLMRGAAYLVSSQFYRGCRLPEEW